MWQALKPRGLHDADHWILPTGGAPAPAPGREAHNDTTMTRIVQPEATMGLMRWSSYAKMHTATVETISWVIIAIANT
jgi:hypothetical protein